MILKTCIELDNGLVANVCCFDGIAIANVIDNQEEYYILTYPKRIDLNVDEKEEILKYCGLYDLTTDYIHFGDIMLTYGQITSNENKENLRGLYDSICLKLTEMETGDTLDDEEYQILLQSYRNLINTYDF